MTEILVEVRPKDVSGDVARKRSIAPESFANRAGEIADTLTDVATQLRQHLDANMATEKSDRWKLTTVEVEFELALQAEAGVVIARASTGATFRATLTWSRGEAV